jgi:hypothetical protein
VQDASLIKIEQGLEQLYGPPTNKILSETPKFILMQQFVEVDAEQLKYNTHMVPEKEELLHLNNTITHALVGSWFKKFQDLYLS